MELKKVNLELAKKLKELKCEEGSSIFCYEADIKDDYSVYIEELNITIPYDDFKSDLRFPELSLVQMWLREQHNIHVSSWPVLSNKYYCSVSIITDNGLKAIIKSPHDPKDAKSTYEEALEYGILEALKLIKL